MIKRVVRSLVVLLALFILATSVGAQMLISDSMLTAPSEKLLGEKGAYSGITIGFSQRAVAGSGWYENLLRLARLQAEYLGADIIILDAQANLAKQISDIEDLVSRGVDAIIVNPVDPAGVMAAIEQVHEAGIPLINVNSQLVPEANPLCFVGHDTYSFGFVAGHDLAKVWASRHGNTREVKAAFLMGYPKELYSLYESNGMVAGFVSHMLETYNRANLNIVASRYGYWQTDTALKETQDILTAHPDLDVLFALDGNMLMGAYAAIQAAGKEGEILIATAGGRREELEMLMDMNSGLVSTSLVDPRKEGKWAVFLAANAARGETIPTEFYIPVVGITLDNVKDLYDPSSKF